MKKIFTNSWVNIKYYTKPNCEIPACPKDNIFEKAIKGIGIFNSGWHV